MSSTDLFGKLFAIFSTIFFTLFLFKNFGFWGAAIGIPVGYILGSILYFIIIIFLSLFKKNSREN